MHVTSMDLDVCHLHGSGCLSPPWVWMLVTSMDLDVCHLHESGTGAQLDSAAAVWLQVGWSVKPCPMQVGSDVHYVGKY